MKNVHILPTDKPSRLFYNVGGALLFTSYESRNGVDIYITSDEEIKEGDWFYLDDAIIVTKYINVKPDKEAQKIILTTNQDLIKDGVQAIDDTFLEWFVKNPSCEEVEVESNYRVISGTIQEHKEGKAGYEYYDYKIIIPKEEQKLINNCPKCGLDLVIRESCTPICTDIDCGGIVLSNETLKEWQLKEEQKQRLIDMMKGDEELGLYEEPKQETTLEEAAERIAMTKDWDFESSEGNGYYDYVEGFTEGAKWMQKRSQSIVPFDAYNIEVFAIKPDEQGKLFAYIGYKISNGNFHFNVVPFTEPQQERMYSEEEVKHIVLEALQPFTVTVDLNQWFEQFKKKTQ